MMFWSSFIKKEVEVFNHVCRTKKTQPKSNHDVSNVYATFSATLIKNVYSCLIMKYEPWLLLTNTDGDVRCKLKSGHAKVLI